MGTAATETVAEVRAAVEAAHIHYDEYRWSMISADHCQLVAERGWTPALRGPGIAGIRNFSKVGPKLHNLYSFRSNTWRHCLPD